MASPPRPQLTGLTLAQSTNGTVRTGATLLMDFTAPGGLLILARSEITTASVAATFTLQVSNDTTTWYDVKLPNNAAAVATAAGTGSAVVTTLALTVPEGVYAAKYLRCNAVLAGAGTVSVDKTSVVYQYVPQGKLSAYA